MNPVHKIFFYIAHYIPSKELQHFHETESVKEFFIEKCKIDTSVVLFSRSLLKNKENNRAQHIAEIYQYLRANWVYCLEPNMHTGDGVFTVAEQIKNYKNCSKFYGDCKSFSILNASVLASLGFRTFICISANHAVAAVLVSDTEKLDLCLLADAVVSNAYDEQFELVTIDFDGIGRNENFTYKIEI